jgi:glyoxalase family protein
MKLEGLHHITAITGDAPRNVEFYAGTLGLRMVKKTVNQDDPTVYHLFYGDEHGSPGADITFFEYPGAVRGRPGAGMVHRIVWRVASPEAIDFWEQRLGDEGVPTQRTDGGLRFADPEGLDHELVVGLQGDEGLAAEYPDIPQEMALQGFAGVRAYSASPERSAGLLDDAMGFHREGNGWELRGDLRGSTYVYDDPPAESGIPGAGTIHHVAWASRIDELADWRARVQQGGARPTDKIDRFYFR